MYRAGRVHNANLKSHVDVKFSPRSSPEITSEARLQSGSVLSRWLRKKQKATSPIGHISVLQFRRNAISHRDVI